ncbi:ergothioneine biosynthesis protein EgtB, partial [Streptomyces sp. NPDC002586]
MTAPETDTATTATKQLKEPKEVDTEALRERALASLTAARARTTLLTSCVEDPDLTAQHSPLMS